MARASAEYEVRARDRSKTAMRSVRSNLKSLSKQVFSVRSAMALLSGGALGALIKRSISAGSNIQKFSIRLGASTEALSQYQLVAERAGISFNTVTIGIQRMTRRIAEAAQGSGEAQGALAELGVDVQALSRLRPDQQFEVMADALARVDDQSQRVRLAFKLFDSEGVALLQTMEGGAAGIRSVREEADEMGLTLTRLQANELAAAEDAMTDLKKATGGLTQQFAVSLAPQLTSIATSLKDVLAPAVYAVQTAFKTVGKLIGGIAATMALIVQGNFAGAVDTLAESFFDLTKASENSLDKSFKRQEEAILGIADAASTTGESLSKDLLGPMKLVSKEAKEFETLQKKIKSIVLAEGRKKASSSNNGSNRTTFGRQVDLSRDVVEGFNGPAKAQKVSNPEQDKILKKMLATMNKNQRNGGVALVGA